MENTYYYMSEITKMNHAWVKNSLGHKRKIHFKRVLSTNRLLILIEFASSRHFGFRNKEDLLATIGLENLKTDLWLDPDTSKVFKIEKDKIIQVLKKDSSFELHPIFSQLTTLKNFTPCHI